MAGRSGTSARAQALAKAADAVARRDSERIARENAIQGALAGFFQAQNEVERIHAAAERSTAPFDAAMRNAIQTLSRLGENRAEIAGLTGAPLARVREYLTEPPAPVTQDGTAKQ